MREAEPGSENRSVSHGICACCAERERAKAKRHAGLDSGKNPGLDKLLGETLVAQCTRRADQNEELKPGNGGRRRQKKNLNLMTSLTKPSSLALPSRTSQKRFPTLSGLAARRIPTFYAWPNIPSRRVTLRSAST
jgi:hypothetical protein